MSEYRLMSAQEPHDRAWPVWEVQGHGTVTAVGDPRDGAERHEILPPWVDVRLTFQDGARIDVLAVVRDGRIAIEDAQADPPLELDGFAALADAIEAPLRNACQVVAGPHRPPVPQPAAAVPCEVLPDAVEPGEAPAEALDPRPDAPARADRPEPEAAPEPGPAPASAPAPGTTDVETAPDAAREAPVEGDHVPAESGRHRARTSAPRGVDARRGVAEIYRAAQSAGQDPVLAVMSATGFSRRKALRLIAGARDDGHLSPRHHRR
ncbi:DUF6214 family protein [Streptomyces sp. NPDC096310]|uniref:DUF6214 family protein n=1 Tax=Streptomyces sp. NPDC096310 TaxID=3366082 RepID=UPI00380B64BA